MGDVEKYLDAHTRALAQRGQFPTLWESVAEVLAPRRMGFTSEWSPGSQKTDKLFDTAPMLAARGLASALDGLIKPKQTQWFEIETEDPDIMKQEGVAEWCYEAERTLFKEIYHPKARFMQATGEADFDLVTFGNAMVFCTESSTRETLLFRTHHMKDICFIENSDGAVDTVHLAEKIPVNVAAQRWGEENLGERAKDLIKADKGNDKLKYLQVIMPRYERDPRKNDNKNMPFKHVVIECDSNHLVRESGFMEFPGAASRWDTTAGEVYGRGPGTLALPDVMTCQQIKRTLLKAGHRAVDPPWIAARNLMMGAAQNRPGGITFFDGVEAAKIGGMDPIKQLESRANLPFGMEMLNQERQEVSAAFYRNILNLPMNGPDMTATEVIQRREEFIREIGAVFGRLETEYVTPLVERAFSLMMVRSVKQGFQGSMTFNQPPKALSGQAIRFKFSSPIDRAKRQIEASQAQQWIMRAVEVSKIKPDVLDGIDFDAAIRLDAEANDVPPSLLMSPERLAQDRARREKEKVMAQNLEAGEQVASMGKDGGAGIKALAEAAQGMMQQ
jgi:hypothetical protein